MMNLLEFAVILGGAGIIAGTVIYQHGVAERTAYARASIGQAILGVPAPQRVSLDAVLAAGAAHGDLDEVDQAFEAIPHDHRFAVETVVNRVLEAGNYRRYFRYAQQMSRMTSIDSKGSAVL